LVSVDSHLSPEEEHYDSFLRGVVIHAIEDVCSDRGTRLTTFGSLSLNLDDYLSMESQHYVNVKQMQIPSSISKRLRSEFELSVVSSKDFDIVTDNLFKIMNGDDPSKFFFENKPYTEQIRKYLSDYIQHQGSRYMAAWNREKFGTVDRLIEEAASGGKIENNEWQWIARSVYAANPEPHWNKPLEAPQLLKEIQ
jgi:hypothetical protein